MKGQVLFAVILATIGAAAAQPALEAQGTSRRPAVVPVSRAVKQPPRATRKEPAKSARRPASKPLTFRDITPASVNTEPTSAQFKYREGPVVVRAQVLLDRANFSVGVIDGLLGRNTKLALEWYQKSKGIPATGELDAATYESLGNAFGKDSAVKQFTIDPEVAEGPYVVVPEDVYAQAKLECLCYSSALELLAERFHTTPAVLQKLNPKTDFAKVTVGEKVWVPGVVDYPPPGPEKVAAIRISKTESYVHALAKDGRILYHFPTTLGSDYDPSPDGRYRVTYVALDPVFRYQPKLFSEVPDHKPEALLPPGPNSPVGTVWIALSRKHVGIHGTSTPETIGVAESHGCVRLTNWDVEKLALVTPTSIPVEFLP